MDTSIRFNVSVLNRGSGRIGWLQCAVVCLSLLSLPAHADDPLSMAPPINNGVQSSIDQNSDSIFNWTEIPENERVPINRAVFDHGGYQLYDTVGETIVVPFTNNNLYVMKFGISSDGTMYMINDGGSPTLYLPRDGYLENATVAGGRWYPFTQDFHPSRPVYVACAPSYPVFTDMGWYPDMWCFGGYWGSTPFYPSDFFATVGFVIVIGNHHFHDFDRFHDFCNRFPPPRHDVFWRRGIYNRWHDNRFAGGRPFEGARRPLWTQQRFRGASNGPYEHPVYQHGSDRYPRERREFRGAGNVGNMPQRHMIFRDPSPRYRVHESNPPWTSGAYQRPVRERRFMAEPGYTTRPFAYSHAPFRPSRSFDNSRVEGGRAYSGGRDSFRGASGWRSSGG